MLRILLCCTFVALINLCSSAVDYNQYIQEGLSGVKILESQADDEIPKFIAVGRALIVEGLERDKAIENARKIAEADARREFHKWCEGLWVSINESHKTESIARYENGKLKDKTKQVTNNREYRGVFFAYRFQLQQGTCYGDSCKDELSDSCGKFMYKTSRQIYKAAR